MVLTASAMAPAVESTGVLPRYLTSNVVWSSSTAIAVPSSAFCPIANDLSSESSK